MRFPVSEPDLSDLELQYVQDAVKSTWISSSGKYLKKFESDFAEITGTTDCLAVSNGTVALHLILLALGIGPGDEVIVPSFTYIASVNAVKYVGATPVFIEVSSTTWGISRNGVEQAITDKTAAVIGVHLYGEPFEVEEVAALCRERNIALIEDAAEAPFSTVNGKPVGSFGLASSFSFYGNKVITSGEGGAVCTSDPELAKKMRLIRSQGMDPERRYFFPVIGHNFRLTNVAAAILCAQLDRLDEILPARGAICEEYDRLLSDSILLDPQSHSKSSVWTPWLVSFVMKEGLSHHREALLAHLDSKGIETRPFFIPVHELPPYEEEARVTPPLPITTLLAQSGFNLPTASTMKISDVQEICAEIKAFEATLASLINRE